MSVFFFSLSFPTVQCSYSLSLPLSLPPSLPPSVPLSLSLPFPTDQCLYPPSPLSNRAVFIPSLFRFQQISVRGTLSLSPSLSPSLSFPFPTDQCSYSLSPSLSPSLSFPFPTDQCSYSLSLSLPLSLSLFPLSNRSVFVLSLSLSLSLSLFPLSNRSVFVLSLSPSLSLSPFQQISVRSLGFCHPLPARDVRGNQRANLFPFRTPSLPIPSGLRWPISCLDSPLPCQQPSGCKLVAPTACMVGSENSRWNHSNSTNFPAYSIAGRLLPDLLSVCLSLFVCLVEPICLSVSLSLSSSFSSFLFKVFSHK